MLLLLGLELQQAKQSISLVIFIQRKFSLVSSKILMIWGCGWTSIYRLLPYMGRSLLWHTLCSRWDIGFYLIKYVITFDNKKTSILMSNTIFYTFFKSYWSSLMPHTSFEVSGKKNLGLNLSNKNLRSFCHSLW
jgi:hypothetical protein